MKLLRIRKPLSTSWLIGIGFAVFTGGLLAQDADVTKAQASASGVPVSTTTSHEERVIRTPASAKPAPPIKASKSFTPSERIQFDSAVAFPTDI